MILYGASGHAKVIIDCVQSNGEEVVLLFDDNPHLSDLLGIPVEPYKSDTLSKEKLLVAIGDNKTRKKISQQVKHESANVIHSSAQISPNCSMGKGVAVMHESIIQSGAQLGNHVIINTAALVEHDCQIESYTHIAPKAILCGDVQVGEGTLIGAGAVVKQGVKIGKWCVIGAGAVVIENVEDNTTVVGNPAKPLEK